MNDFLAVMKTAVLERVNTMEVAGTLTPNTLDFCQIFNHKPAIIAEIKFASPSKGLIYRGNLDHVAIAASYLKHGAQALSVLTEPHYFQGQIDYLWDIRRAFPHAHLLLKDFVLREVQLKQALVSGANAVLLIAAFLEDAQLLDLHDAALGWGLTPLVEVHDLTDLERVAAMKPKIIGINNRNLKTMSIDLDVARALIKQVSTDSYSICESGIERADQIQSMCALGFDGFLIGSSLMVNDDPGVALAQLLND